MKKRLFSIIAFLWIWLSFCSAENVSNLITFVWSWHIDYAGVAWTTSFVNLLNIWTDYWTYCINLYNWTFSVWNIVALWFANSSVWTPNNNYFLYSDQFSNYICLYWNKSYLNVWNRCLTTSQCIQNLTFSADYEIFKLNTLLDESITTSCPSSSIDVLYNNENSSTTITCDWDNVIQIDWLSTITAINKRTPYFNINYRDQDNQSLVESYSNNNLYLSGWLFKKTYTWDNEWILTIQWNNNNSFSWYMPTFDITGWINDITDSWNIFNNFAENSVKFTLSNIPSYIQYVIIIMLLLFIIWFIRKFKRR